jgi:hypothetical protein
MEVSGPLHILAVLYTGKRLPDTCLTEGKVNLGAGLVVLKKVKFCSCRESNQLASLTAIPAHVITS